MSERPKRLAPLPATLRELFLKSGNLCMFPDCGRLMMDADGDFVGEVCHIEAAEKRGQRFNSAMTNEERRSVSNLMLMCGPHHKKTNNVDRYPVERLRKFKEDHERRFAHPDRAILEKLRDWTGTEEPKTVRNLKRLIPVTDSDYDDEMRKADVKTLNEYVEWLSRIPLPTRSFLGAVMKRIWRMKNSGVTDIPSTGPNMILVSDIAGAFRLPEKTVVEQAKELAAYGLGGLDRMDTQFALGPAVYVAFRDGWNFWLTIADFCAREKIPIETFTDELDFTPLDARKKRRSKG